ncbi:hypothetical protein HN592_05060 [Candidatus Woesearchaeota archaeon]|jgi:hypothetical protein|nr:hypothetical protein [Candidatus Woesearchaeota archaeon]MBT4367756.1 hypothetical protein [Candidatus Woesearchaeota archaeon]MBT4712244.1 hypothetical protein [Candidatus Woesearchaeota archaeon]MBT6638792.1 hypothetical protein [Candidatus Woesearchaeota archaeon]MBT7134436.1 hypothetical protein [Candidatus Woesearchaeota archaeon]
MPLGFEGVSLSIIIATLAAIVYSLRVLVVLERRISRIDLNMERMTERILFEEGRIEKALKMKPVKIKKKVVKKKPAKKKVSKKKK